jgi:hypothetical protein
MVPAAVHLLEALPLTANGKVDRQALAERAAAGVDAEPHVPPRSALEAVLAELWRDLLGAERVGAHDDFFRLGGSSLQIGELTARIAEELGVEIGPREVFAAPTVAGMAVAVTRVLAERAGGESLDAALREAAAPAVAGGEA